MQLGLRKKIDGYGGSGYWILGAITNWCWTSNVRLLQNSECELVAKSLRDQYVKDYCNYIADIRM
jgi:hypothetical protein